MQRARQYNAVQRNAVQCSVHGSVQCNAQCSVQSAVQRAVQCTALHSSGTDYTVGGWWQGLDGFLKIALICKMYCDKPNSCCHFISSFLHTPRRWMPLSPTVRRQHPQPDMGLREAQEREAGLARD